MKTNKDYISRKRLVKVLLEERDRHPPMTVQDRYGFGIATPNRFNQALRGGIRMALRAVETAPAEQVVSLELLKQIRWERDVAIQQLEELNIGFGQVKPDMVEVVRCKSCKYCRFGYCAHDKMEHSLCREDDYCSYGVPKGEGEEDDEGDEE